MNESVIIPRNVINEKIEMEINMFSKDITVTPEQLPHYILGILLLYYILSPQYVVMLYIYKAILSLVILLLTFITTQYKKHGLTIGENVDLYIYYLISKIKLRRK